MVLILCKTCAKATVNELYFPLSVKCHQTIASIKEMIIFCVPTMESALSSDEYICKPCLEALIVSVSFIEVCLKANFQENSILRSILEGNDQKILQENEFQNKVETIYITENSNDLEVDSKPVIQDIKAEEHCSEENILIKIVNLDHDYDREVHLKKKRKMNLRKCPQCNEHFMQVKELKKHMSQIHKDYRQDKYECKHCNTKFWYKKGYIYHLKYKCKSIEDEYKPFSCTKCRKKYLTKQSLHNHETKCGTIKMKTCPVCSEKFTEKEYVDHCTIHPSYLCELCAKCFKSKFSLKAHKLTHNEPDSFICPQCGKGLKTIGSLRNHIRYTHERGPQLMCDQCPNTYRDERRLKLHKKRMHDIGEKKKSYCEQCNKEFATEGYAKEHKKLVHERLKPYSCVICGKIFGRKDYLDNHVLWNHKGVPRPIRPNIKRKRVTGPRKRLNIHNPGPDCKCKCSICGKIYKNLDAMKTHMNMRHFAVRRFECSGCELKFITKISRDRHQKLHSDPTYRFRCNICFKRKTSDEELEQHIETVHKNKPYVCEYCSEEFVRRYLLENHISSEHPSENSQEELLEKMKEALERVEFIS